MNELERKIKVDEWFKEELKRGQKLNSQSVKGGENIDTNRITNSPTSK